MMSGVRSAAGIRVERPDPRRLKALNVAAWPIWTKELSTFDWTYEEQETCYFLEGQVVVRTEEGELSIGTGDLATFPKGLSCTWQVTQAVRKHYRFDDPAR